jgi:hypothetical protein
MLDLVIAIATIHGDSRYLEPHPPDRTRKAFIAALR